MWSLREIWEACQEMGIDVVCGAESLTYTVPRGDGTHELRLKQRPIHLTPFSAGQSVAIMSGLGKGYRHVASFTCVRAGRGESAAFDSAKGESNPLTHRMMLRRLEGAYSTEWGVGPEWFECGKCG